MLKPLHLIEQRYGWTTKLLYQSPHRWHKFVTTGHTGEQLSFEVFVYLLVGGFQFFRVDCWHGMTQRQTLQRGHRDLCSLLLPVSWLATCGRIELFHHIRTGQSQACFSFTRKWLQHTVAAGVYFTVTSSPGDQWQGRVFGVEQDNFI